MSASIYLVNPRGGKRRRRKVRAKGSSRRRTRAVRRRRPVAARPARRRARNPRALRRFHRRRHATSRRQRARNPRFSVGSITRMIVPAAIGGLGGIGLNVAMAYLPIPDQYKTGWVGTGVKVLAALGLGMVVGKVFGKQNGALVGGGALTVIAYNAINNAIPDELKQKVKGLSGYQDFTDYQGPSRVGAYMHTPPALGYVNPAASLASRSRGDGMGAYMDNSSMMGMGM